jgi:hypothetical protein
MYLYEIDERVEYEAELEDYNFFRTHPNEDWYIRIMHRGETFGYFPPLSAVFVVKQESGAFYRDYLYPPKKAWRELEQRYGKMLHDEMLYHLEKDFGSDIMADLKK